MRPFGDEVLLTTQEMEDPTLMGEVWDEMAFELSDVSLFPFDHVVELPLLDQSFMEEVGLEACILIAEQQAALYPAPQRIAQVPYKAMPLPLPRRPARKKSSPLIPLLFLALLVILAGMALGNLVGTGSDVSSTSSDTNSSGLFGTTSTNRPIVRHGYNVTTGNELSAKQINQLFAENGSPAAGDGQVVVDLGNKYGLDDIYFPAWYLKETSMGKGGVASVNNPTGMECSDLCPRCSGADSYGRNWCEFDTIPQGFEAWYKQTHERYVSGLIDLSCSYPQGRRVCHPGVRLTTVYLIACGPDGQGMYDGGTGCAGYANDIQGFVDGWRARFGS